MPANRTCCTVGESFSEECKGKEKCKTSGAHRVKFQNLAMGFRGHLPPFREAVQSCRWPQHSRCDGRPFVTLGPDSQEEHRGGGNPKGAIEIRPRKSKTIRNPKISENVLAPCRFQWAPRFHELHGFQVTLKTELPCTEVVGCILLPLAAISERHDWSPNIFVSYPLCMNNRILLCTAAHPNAVGSVFMTGTHHKQHMRAKN